MNSRPVIILDRDGTLIEDTGYLRDPQPVELLPFVVEGLKEMRRKGYLLFLVSNQSGVGRGLISDAEFTAVHEKVIGLLEGEGIALDGYGYCFHKPEDECDCRKPRPGLVPKTLANAPLDLARSFVVGDRTADVALGHAVGAQPILILTGVGRQTLEKLPADPPWRVAENLLDVANSIPSL